MSSKKLEDSKALVLVDSPKRREKILGKVINSICCCVCGIPRLPELIYHRFRPNPRGYKEQSCKRIINGETVYESVKRKEITALFCDVRSIPALFVKSLRAYSATPCMGRRRIIQKKVEKCPVLNKEIVSYEFGTYVWKTYTDVYLEICHTARKLIALDFGSYNKFALFCNTSPEWLTMAYALLFLNCPIVTVYSTLSEESIMNALIATEVQGIMVDEKTLPRLIPILHHLKSVKYVVLSKYLESSYYLPRDTLELIKFYDFDDFRNYSGEANFCIDQPIEPDSVAFIMYTSGTTAEPKGVVISHKNIIACLKSVSEVRVLLRSSNGNKPHRYPAYLPSSHIFECVLEIAMLTFGHSIAFSTPLTLFDTSSMIMKGTHGDLTVFRPTLIITVPLLLERVKKQVIEQIKTQSRLKQLIFQSCYNVKLKFRNLGYKTHLLDKTVFKPLRNIFGGKLKLGFIGGAYISKENVEFANICFGEFRQGYGLTESSSGVTLVNYNYLRAGSCGGPISDFQIKLLDTPEGHVCSAYPSCATGEIAISADSLALGYYNNQELTDQYFTVDPQTGKRWFRTGDIGVMLPDLTLKIIDRKKDIVKLSHGEYISLINVESIIMECPVVEMVCVVPNKSFENLIAIIVPQREKTAAYFCQILTGFESNELEEVLGWDEIRALLADYVKTCVVEKLLKNEIPSKFVIVQDLWLPENNLVTPTMKVRRQEIFKKYEALLD